MPPLTRWYIKSALIYLLAALLLAIALALANIISLPPFILAMNPAYFHLFLVGWVTQMIFGVIYWMFPIITRAQPRGNARLGWSSYILLNAGLLLRVFVEPQIGRSSAAGLGWLLTLAALCQWLAAAIFVFLAWPRVKDRYRGE